jgi:hypothetical protein
MSNHDNGRRDEKKRTEHGPRYEGGGSDNSSVARARSSWKKIGNRQFRRTGTTRGVGRMAGGGRLKPMPKED